MMLPNPNHPTKGSHIMVEPIRDLAAIEQIKSLLKNNPRNYCIFIFGINTACRANEFLDLRVGQVRNLREGDLLNIKPSQSGKHRDIPMNANAIQVIDQLLSSRKFQDHEFLFQSQRKGNTPLGVSTLSTYVKEWCQKIELKGNYASHSLRKTWGYWQRIKNNTPIPLLMEAFNHSTRRQTMEYLGLPMPTLKEIYMKLLL